MAFLGSLIFHSEDISRITEKAAPLRFRNPGNEKIFDVIMTLHRAYLPIDLVEVRDVLVSRGQLEQAGGADYLISLIEAYYKTSDFSNLWTG